VGERSKTPTTRARNAHSQVSQVHQQPEPEQERNQEDASIGKRLKRCLPTDLKSFLFALVVVVYLIIGVIHFGETGDPSMLAPLLYTVGAYAGLSEGKALFSRGKKGGPDL